MIVVIGSPIGRIVDGVVRAGGPACRLALAAAADGRAVQLVGKTGDDPTADAVILDLARGGVGHVALLRDPARRTSLEAPDAPDVDDERPDDELKGGGSPPSDHSDGPDPTLEAADIELGMRYLTEFAVVVLTGSATPAIIATVTEAASWGEARLIVVVDAGQAAPEGLLPEVVVFEAPKDDPDGAFADLVGAFAAGLDGGATPGDAFRSSIAVDGWSESPSDGG